MNRLDRGVSPSDSDASPLERLFLKGRFLPFLRHVFAERLTYPGQVMMWAGILAMGAGAFTLVIQIYLVFCLLASLALASMILARLARVRLVVDAELPSRTTCGARLSLPIRARNESRRTAVDVVLRDLKLPRAITSSPADGAYLRALGPGQQTVLHRELEFKRRGHYELAGMRQETLFPWGLWRDLLDHEVPRSLLVYPRFHPLVRLDIPVGKRYQPGGIALSSNVGDSIEFIGTREYRDGDNVRAIHSRTWARLGKPAVKEFQEEYFCRVALLMDTFVPPREDRQRRAAFEAAVSTAAAIADSLSREEYIIDIFAAGPEIYYLQSGRSLAYLENVLDILACLEPCSDPPFEKITPVLVEHLGSITTTVVVLLDWDDHRADMVRMILDHGSAVKVILVRDGAATGDLAAADEVCGGLTVIDSVQEAAGVEEL